MYDNETAQAARDYLSPSAQARAYANSGLGRADAAASTLSIAPRRVQALAAQINELTKDAHVLLNNLRGDLDRLTGAQPECDNAENQTLSGDCELDEVARNMARLSATLNACLDQTQRLAAI